jgi:hypothetical protein
MRTFARLCNRSPRRKAGNPRSPEPSSTDDQPPPDRPRFDRRFERVDAVRDERNELQRLRDEARYRRERLDLYRARLYGGRAVSQGKLRELQRASDGAAARLRQAEAAARRTDPPA